MGQAFAWVPLWPTTFAFPSCVEGDCLRLGSVSDFGYAIGPLRKDWMGRAEYNNKWAKQVSPGNIRSMAGR